MNELGIKPEHECFDIGHVGSLAPLVDMGVLQAAAARRLRHGRRRRHPADRAQPRRDGRQHARAGSHWGVIGISRVQWTLVGAALTLGGSIRVGLEDNFYLPDGEMARSNGDLIAKARADDRSTPAAGPRRSSEARDAARRPAARTRAADGVSGLPLEGVRVLDLSRLLPGGFCSLLLADFGADVLKVEDTGMGDYVRWSPPYYEGAEQSAGGALFLALNRGKTSIRMNLKTDEGREVLLRLVRGRRRRCSSPSARACSTASASATSGCARRTRGSSTARSPATARTARCATAPATT